MENAINFLIKKLTSLSAILLGVMVGYVTLHTILRYFFSGGLPSVYPLVQVMLVAIVFLSLPLSQLQKEHIRITFMTDKIGGKIAIILEYIVILSATMFAVLMCYGGWTSFVQSVSIGEYYQGSVNITVIPARLAVFVGSLFFTIRLLFDIIQIPKDKDIRKEQN